MVLGFGGFVLFCFFNWCILKHAVSVLEAHHRLPRKINFFFSSFLIAVFSILDIDIVLAAATDEKCIKSSGWGQCCEKIVSCCVLIRSLVS